MILGSVKGTHTAQDRWVELGKNRIYKDKKKQTESREANTCDFSAKS